MSEDLLTGSSAWVSKCSVNPSPSASGPSLVKLFTFLLSSDPACSLFHTNSFLASFFPLRQKILPSLHWDREAGRRLSEQRKHFLLALGLPYDLLEGVQPSSHNAEHTDSSGHVVCVTALWGWKLGFIIFILLTKKWKP